jgi:D-alanine transaminase
MVYLNGKMLPIEEAKISVLDRGFLLGDGVYEVIPAYGGCLFRLEQHLQRLQNSLDAIRISNPHTNAEWEKILNELIAQDSAEDQSVYLQVTRGVAAKRDHAFPDKVVATVFAMSNRIAAVSEETLQQGIAAITLDDIRWQRCDIKAITLLANVMLRQQAHDEGAAESILISQGYALEGAASNLFIVDKGRIITPPKSSHLLPGVTRDLVLELARQHQLDYEERPILAQELSQADEIWMTSSTKEILPVSTLDQRTVGDGKPGPVWKKMIELYRQYKQQLRTDCH